MHTLPFGPCPSQMPRQHCFGAAEPAQMASPNRCPRRPKVLKVGSDFSGIDTACIAIRRMGIEHQLLFASDVDTNARMVLKKVHAPTMIWDDALARTPDDEVYVGFLHGRVRFDLVVKMLFLFIVSRW